MCLSGHICHSPSPSLEAGDQELTQLFRSQSQTPALTRTQPNAFFPEPPWSWCFTQQQKRSKDQSGIATLGEMRKGPRKQRR